MQDRNTVIVKADFPSRFVRSTVRPRSPVTARVHFIQAMPKISSDTLSKADSTSSKYGIGTVGQHGRSWILSNQTNSICLLQTNHLPPIISAGGCPYFGLRHPVIGYRVSTFDSLPVDPPFYYLNGERISAKLPHRRMTEMRCPSPKTETSRNTVSSGGLLYR